MVTRLSVGGAGGPSLVWGRSAWDGVNEALDALPAGLRAAVPSPGSGWRIYTVAATMPRFEPASWRLRVEGDVSRPLALRMRDLRALPRAEQVSDFHCVTGWSVRNVRWAGVRIRDVLALAEPLEDAKAIRFVSLEQP